MTYPIQIQKRRDLLQPQEFLPHIPERRLGAQIVRHTPEVSIEANCAKLREPQGYDILLPGTNDDVERKPKEHAVVAL